MPLFFSKGVRVPQSHAICLSFFLSLSVTLSVLLPVFLQRKSRYRRVSFHKDTSTRLRLLVSRVCCECALQEDVDTTPPLLKKQLVEDPLHPSPLPPPPRSPLLLLLNLRHSSFPFGGGGGGVCVILYTSSSTSSFLSYCRHV